MVPPQDLVTHHMFRLDEHSRLTHDLAGKLRRLADENEELEDAGLELSRQTLALKDEVGSRFRSLDC